LRQHKSHPSFVAAALRPIALDFSAAVGSYFNVQIDWLAAFDFSVAVDYYLKSQISNRAILSLPFLTFPFPFSSTPSAT
jgi:hypothetical protein